MFIKLKRGGDFMRASTKERGMLLAISAVFLSVIIFGGYFLFGPKKVGSTITSQVKIIDKNDKDTLRIAVKYSECYAFKLEENGACFIELYKPLNSNESFREGKYDMDKKDFDTLELSKYYWFNIKYKKPDMYESGTVIKVYTENPMRR
jgi:hypothetical protein